MSIPTKEEALDIAKRYIDCAFQNKGELPRHSIPANPDRDDDIRLIEFIQNSIQPPARQEGETPVGAKLRAMAANYKDGHLWDHLDAETCIKAADELSSKQAEVDLQKREKEEIKDQYGAASFKVAQLETELESLKAAQFKSTAHIVEADGKILNPYALYHAMCKMEILCDESDDAKFGTISTSTLRAMIEEATPPVERSVDGE